MEYLPVSLVDTSLLEGKLKAKADANDSPVTKYGGLSAGKRGIDLKTHAAIVVEGTKPPPVRGLMSEAFLLDRDTMDAHFSANSLINFGKVYTVEHSQRVRYLGDLRADSALALQRKYRETR
jgi:hypothetical protein